MLPNYRINLSGFLDKYRNLLILPSNFLRESLSIFHDFIQIYFTGGDKILRAGNSRGDWAVTLSNMLLNKNKL